MNKEGLKEGKKWEGFKVSNKSRRERGNEEGARKEGNI